MKREIKFQIKALKKLGKGLKVYYDKSGSLTYLAPDECRAVLIYKRDFFLDTDQLYPNNTLADMFSPKNLETAYELKVSDDMKKTNSVTALALVCDKFTTWVNQKWFKELKDKSALIYAKDEKSSVYLVRNNIIYAVIMPINLNEKD